MNFTTEQKIEQNYFSSYFKKSSTFQKLFNSDTNEIDISNYSLKFRELVINHLITNDFMSKSHDLEKLHFCTYQKNRRYDEYDINPIQKSLYSITEKIRYETLGGIMLKGIRKNFIDNYNQIISLKRKDQLKSKEDVTVNEAFELYMLKNFHNIQLNSLTKKMLSFWENEFDQSIGEHIKFLRDNFENQDKYSSKFSEILQKMDIFQNEDNDDTKEQNPEENQEIGRASCRERV